MFSRFIRFIVLQLVHLFYPHIEVKGLENLPAQGPIIFVLNHPNGLLDPMLLIIGLQRPVSFLAKSTFFANPVGHVFMKAFEALPIYRSVDEGQVGGPQNDATERNEKTFARCRTLLRQGKALALFPEGATHSGTTLLPLRTGAARVALSAEAEANWQLGLQIVPVGLWYQNKTRFRSSALLVIGQPFDLTNYITPYSIDQRQTVRDLTDQIDSRLDGVVLQAENNEFLRGIPLVATWTAPQGQSLTLSEQHARATKLLVAYERLRSTDPVRVEQIAQQARRYARVLRTLGISDPWALELTAAHRGRIAWLLFILIVGFPLAAVGFLLSYGPYRLAAPVTPRLMGPEEELTSTGKLIIGSVLVVLGWLLIAIVWGILFGAIWGVLLFLASPALAYIALRWGESWDELREIVVYRWLYLRYRSLVEALIARRQALAAQIIEAVRATEGEFGEIKEIASNLISQSGNL